MSILSAPESVITALRSVTENCVATSPRKGARVTVKKGPRAGLTGIVTWHGPDKYYRNYYEDSFQNAMRIAIGESGFRVRIAPEEGGEAFEPFFTTGTNVTVLQGPGEKKV